jgi:hypothetical protein
MSLVGCQVKNKGLKLTTARVTTYHVVSPQQALDLKVLLIIHVPTYIPETSKHSRLYQHSVTFVCEISVCLRLRLWVREIDNKLAFEITSCCLDSTCKSYLSVLLRSTSRHSIQFLPLTVTG